MSDSLPLVTIVTPSFNQGRFIRETLESVFTQDYPRIEYLVMDGGSTDETLDVLRSHGSRVVWVSEPDRGQAHAINKAWRRARGEIIAYLNSDDRYLPGAVGKAVIALQANPDAVGVYGEGYHVDQAGRILERYPTEPFSLARLEEACFICQPTCFLRRAAVERAGYLDESLRYSLDYDLWIRLARVGRFVYLPAFLAVTRLHEDAKTIGQRAQAHREILGTVKRHFGHVSPSWAYAYAHAVLGDTDVAGRSRLGAWRTLRLVAVTGTTFLRHNWRGPVWEWGRWKGAVAHGWRRFRERGR
jgi:glycosyltransferase involved in cell wall biosynthesis